MLGLGLGVDKMAGRSAAVSEETPGTIFSQDDFFWINTDRSPVTLDGSGNVELIENLGNFGGDMQQGTVSNRPGYGITQLNGKDVMDLDGVSEFLESTLPAGDWSFLHDGSLATVIIVGHPGNSADPNSLNVLLSTHDFSANTIGYSIGHDTRDGGRDNVLLSFSSNGSSSTLLNESAANYIAANNWHHMTDKVDADNGVEADRSETHANGLSLFKNNSRTNSPTTSSPLNPLRIGRGGSFYLTGKIAEIIIIKGRHITASEQSELHDRYFPSEWGI